MEATVVDNWLDHSEGKDGKTIWSAIKPVVQSNKEMFKIMPYERANRVFLVPGDIRLSEYERDLNQSWVDCLQRKPRGFVETSALANLVNYCAEQVQANYIFYDIGPNIGPLNRVILMDCDFFIVPAACDYFSVRALKTLGHSVVSWIRDWRVIATLAPEEVQLLSGMPIFMGYILQRFRMYGGDIAQEYQQYARQLEKSAFSDIVAVLREFDKNLAPGSASHFNLGQIKDFASIANLAQKQGLAMEDANGGTPYLKDQARQAFRDLASMVMARAEAT